MKNVKILTTLFIKGRMEKMRQIFISVILAVSLVLCFLTIDLYGEEVNIMENKNYNSSVSANISYVDKDNSELTDGLYASSVYYDPGWSGYIGANPSFNFDLNGDYDILCVRIRILCDITSGIRLPSKIELFGSVDNLNFIKRGETVTYKLTEGGTDLGIYEFVINEINIADQKYLRFDFTADSGWWLFISEIEAIGHPSRLIYAPYSALSNTEISLTALINGFADDPYNPTSLDLAKVADFIVQCQNMGAKKVELSSAYSGKAYFNISKLPNKFGLIQSYDLLGQILPLLKQAGLKVTVNMSSFLWGQVVLEEAKPLLQKDSNNNFYPLIDPQHGLTFVLDVIDCLMDYYIDGIFVGEPYYNNVEFHPFLEDPRRNERYITFYQAIGDKIKSRNPSAIHHLMLPVHYYDYGSYNFGAGLPDHGLDDTLKDVEVDIINIDLNDIYRKNNILGSQQYLSSEPANPVYPDGHFELTDSTYGNVDFYDPAYAGYSIGNPSFTFDLGRPLDGHFDIAVEALSILSAGIKIPVSIEYYASTDGLNYILKDQSILPKLILGTAIEGVFEYNCKNIQFTSERYLKIIIKRDQDSWFFTDHIELTPSNINAQNLGRAKVMAALAQRLGYGKKASVRISLAPFGVYNRHIPVEFVIDQIKLAKEYGLSEIMVFDYSYLPLFTQEERQAISDTLRNVNSYYSVDTSSRQVEWISSKAITTQTEWRRLISEKLSQASQLAADKFIKIGLDEDNSMFTRPGIPIETNTDNFSNSGIFTISWTASLLMQDSTGFIKYNVWRNGELADIVETNSYAENSLTEGRYRYQVYAVGEGFDMSRASGLSECIIVDKTIPSGALKINDDGAYTKITSVTLSLSASDIGGAGLDKMQFSNDNSTWSSLEAYANSKAWMLASGNGTKTVYARFADRAGNASAVASDAIILDNTAPAISGISDSPDPFFVRKNQVSKISYTATDDLAGSLSVSVSIYTSGGSLVRTLGPYTQSQGANFITWDGKNSSGSLVSNATYKYNIKAVDAAGNAATSAYYYVTKK